MKLSVMHQESNSRGELMLRTFFGFLYIYIPHGFALLFLGIWGSILHFISWWVILFTGRYPQSFFEYQAKLMRWQLRLNARIYNLCDGYPAFGLDVIDEKITFEVEYPETFSRGLLLLRTFFGGIYVGIPHGFLLFFVMIGALCVNFVSWWAILVTGRFPEEMHSFIVSYIRWTQRVNLYMLNMTDTYPPFTGKEIE